MYKYFILLLLAGCQTSTTKNLGEQFTPSNVITVNQVNSPGEGYNIKGTISKTCMSEGCWFRIKDSTGTEIHFDVKDKKFRVPINSPGKEVIILADAEKDTAAQQPLKLSVRGMHFK